MEPVTGNALLDAGGAVFGGLLGAFSTNSNNKRIARENQKNRDFAHNEAILAHNRQLEIMDKTNEWNSFENQRKLAEAAGLNPNRVFDAGASGIATSSGASGGSQASQPSSGYSDPLVNPQMMGLMSDIRLKDSQAKLNEAEAGKVSSETKGQDLQNAFQEMSNVIYSEFGRLTAEYELSDLSASIALKDANRLLTRSQHSLNIDELVRMRPAEAGKLVAETLLANSSTALNRVLSAKTEQEMDIALKKLALELQVASATCSNLYASAYHTWHLGYGQELENERWKPFSGVSWRKEHSLMSQEMWRDGIMSNDKSISDAEFSVYNKVMETCKSTIISNLQLQHWTDNWKLKYLHAWWNDTQDWKGRFYNKMLRFNPYTFGDDVYSNTLGNSFPAISHSMFRRFGR